MTLGRMKGRSVAVAPAKRSEVPASPMLVDKKAVRKTHAEMVALYGGEDGKLDHAERVMAKYDINGDGHFSIAEVKNIILDLQAEKDQARQVAVEMMRTGGSSGKTRTCLIIFALLVVYCVAGALVLMALESEVEKEAALVYADTYGKMERSLARLGNWTDMCADRLTAEEVHNDTSEAISSIVATPTKVLNWEISSAIFFTLTLVTTIGYGTFAPTTGWGKGFTIIFSIVGIVLFAYMLTLTSERVHHLLTKFVQRCFRYPKGYCMDSKMGIVVLSACSVAYVFIVAILGAIAYDAWNFGNAVYFAFITFTTIGLGDYSVQFDETRSQVFRAGGYFMWSIGTIVGMALISALIGEIAFYVDEYHKEVVTRLQNQVQTLLDRENEMINGLLSEDATTKDADQKEAIGDQRNDGCMAGLDSEPLSNTHSLKRKGSFLGRVVRSVKTSRAGLGIFSTSK